MAAKVPLIVFSLLTAHTCAQLSVDDLIRLVFNNTLVETTTQRFQPTPTKTTVLDQRSETGGYRSCGVDKECVPKHLCVDGAISTTGETLITNRIMNELCSYSEICCDIPNKKNESVIPPYPKQRHDGCGWRNNEGFGFKIAFDTDNDSEFAEFAEFPWTVAILRNLDSGGELIHMYECGGSFIAPNVVLTASHCVIKRKPHQLVVRGGEWDTQNSNEILLHVDKPVKEIITHEKYNKGTLYNDVALLILEEPFVWQENIRPICLPEPNANFDHSRCFATGWGKDKLGREVKYPVILKKVDLPVVPQATCQKYLRDTRLGLYFNLHESFLCAGGEKDKDTCKGDGGSPLVCPIPGIEGRYYQAGIVAWGVGCAEDNVPGVYANVSYLRPWISEKLAARGIPFTSFTP
ncbi:phenoloxidase-activating factor 2-like [Calliphora vicina]|uniref:phenoloxidase-activating factor 2-like n=1 Tax=Calliphora vicina TaxID=7373 RepID=UPI00325C2A2A